MSFELRNTVGCLAAREFRIQVSVSEHAPGGRASGVAINPSSLCRRANLLTGRLKVLVAVLSRTTLTRPSLPGNVLITLASGQWQEKHLESFRITTSPSCRLGWILVHLVLDCRLCRYSLCHRFQKCWMMDWHIFHFASRCGSFIGEGSVG